MEKSPFSLYKNEKLPQVPSSGILWFENDLVWGGNNSDIVSGSDDCALLVILSLNFKW